MRACLVPAIVLTTVGCSTTPVTDGDASLVEPDGSVIVYRGRAVALAPEQLLTDDGRLVCAHPAGEPFRSTSGIKKLTPWGEALAANGDVLRLKCASTAPAPAPYASAVADILGGSILVRADGSVLQAGVGAAPRDLPELRGATSCNWVVCVQNGALTLNTGVDWGLGQPPTLDGPPPDPLLAQESPLSQRLLSAGGVVHEISGRPGPPVSFTFSALPGLPTITRIDGTFLYDERGQAYYAGPVWSPDAPPQLQLGLSTTLLPSNTATADCQLSSKTTAHCVLPTPIPRLNGATMGLIHGLATYAIQPDGTVKCWATEPTRYPSDAPRCLSFD